MASPAHEDHSDLDSLFGDDEVYEEQENELRELSHHPVISFPRAAVTSQNVGTIAPSPVPSSPEHPPSPGPMSSASIPLASDVNGACSSPRVQGKRAASPEPNASNKKRRVEPAPSASVRSSKVSLDAFGIPGTGARALTVADLRSAMGLLAPTSDSSQAVLPPRASSEVTAISGTGSATDPVVISEESTTAPATSTHGQPSAPRRPSRSQQAYAFIEALPTDPTDVLSQTLRTILKTPTTVPRKGSSVSRDTVVFLVNGRQTGTPFLRLLRHLASPTKRKDKKAGLELLKKLVEAMRATEEAASKATSVGRSSTSSTPMPATPGTPSANSFPTPESSVNPYSLEIPYETALFPQLEYPLQSPNTYPLQALGGSDKPLPTDIAIDPELLAVSQDPGYLQSAPLDLQDFDIDLTELFGSLPTPSSDPTTSTSDLHPAFVSAIDSIPHSASGAREHLGDVSTWGDLANPGLDTLFESWLPPLAPLAAVAPAAQPMAVDSCSANFFPQPALHPNVRMASHPGPSNTLRHTSKQPDVPPGGMRIPNRTEARALLDRARARKKELEAKLSFARRQVWACRIEAGVEKNLLEMLGKK